MAFMYLATLFKIASSNRMNHWVTDKRIQRLLFVSLTLTAFVPLIVSMMKFVIKKRAYGQF